MESSPARSPSRPSRGPASFSTQANALLRKNLTFQKRNMKTNIGIIAFPVFLCLVLFVLKKVIDSELNKAKYRCGCVNGICGVQHSTTDQVDTCPIPSPPKWPALMQVPAPEFRAVRTDILPSVDLPDESCRASRSCPAITLFTGANKSFAQSLSKNFFPIISSSTVNSSDNLSFLSTVTPGTDTPTALTQFIEPAFISIGSLYALQPQCTSNVTREISFDFAGINIRQDLKCAQGLPLWSDSSSSVNEELYKGYRQGNLKGKINEFLAAFDFLNTDEKRFNLVVWYNSTYNNDTAYDSKAFVRAPRSVNVASNEYLKFLKGTNVEIRFEYVALKSLVYEKQQKLNMMMKMHGLKDGPYWLIPYIYYFTLSSIYMICFVIFGSLTGLKLFTSNDYSIQAVFYFICINLQITLAFLVTSFFSSVKTATVIAYMYVFGSSLLGDSVLRTFAERSSFPRGWIIVMELVPAFSLYRGLYEFGQYSSTGDSMGTSGMRWGNLSDSENGMKIVLTIMTAEWLILLPLAFYLDQISIFGDGTKRHPLFFLHHYRKKSSNLQQRLSLQKESSKVYVEMEGPDVAQERDVVEQLLIQPSITHPVISDNLKLVYPGQDGNPDKFAVRGLSLALANGECFGMFGPNGAGKTSFINMMIGLIKPTSGTAYVEGMDISTDMDEVYSNMGVCPQHDLLWETLTGKEHLLFYGRLKNLKGAALMLAVEESLKSVNLYYGGVGDKQAGKYSGGMKRMLSVAISLIGDPKVVYMDEPSTGLDPASRNNLWTVLKRAKTDRAIILTTHSMEEAEVLCDRLGIFVDGNFRCIGNPNELKARYGSSYVFTITTSADQESKVESLVRQLSPNANKICHISGTQKFELPKQEVKISEVFRAIQFAKSNFSIQAWGLADTTPEDVFIKVAKGVV